jgi:hypothetical protein
VFDYFFFLCCYRRQSVLRPSNELAELQSITVKKVIGSGNFGEVFLGDWDGMFSTMQNIPFNLSSFFLSFSSSSCCRYCCGDEETLDCQRTADDTGGH